MPLTFYEQTGTTSCLAFARLLITCQMVYKNQTVVSRLYKVLWKKKGGKMFLVLYCNTWLQWVRYEIMSTAQELRLWSHLLKKSLMENLIFCAVIIKLFFANIDTSILLLYNIILPNKRIKKHIFMSLCFIICLFS